MIESPTKKFPLNGLRRLFTGRELSVLRYADGSVEPYSRKYFGRTLGGKLGRVLRKFVWTPVAVPVVNAVVRNFGDFKAEFK